MKADRLRRVAHVLLLCLLLMPGQAAGGTIGRKPEPLEYDIFGLTLDASPRTFRETLKRAGYLHTKTEQLHGLEVMSFTSAKTHRLYSNAFVASCPATGQTVGVYVYGDDGTRMLDLARERFHLDGNDLATPPADGGVGGRMKIDKAYRKSYPNLTVSFYKNRPFESFTLALESQKALDACARQGAADAAAAARLRQRIEEESRRTQRID